MKKKFLYSKDWIFIYCLRKQANTKSLYNTLFLIV